MKDSFNVLQAIWLAVTLVLAILLVVRLSWVGLALAVLLSTITFLMLRRSGMNPEIEALRASLRVARDGIADVIASYDELINGTSTDAIADRTLNYPALADKHSDIPEIEDFHLRLHSSRRFIARLDTYLTSEVNDRATLENLITVADQRAYELDEAWAEARLAAKRLGP